MGPGTKVVRRGRRPPPRERVAPVLWMIGYGLWPVAAALWPLSAGRTGRSYEAQASPPPTRSGAV